MSEAPLESEASAAPATSAAHAPRAVTRRRRSPRRDGAEQDAPAQPDATPTLPGVDELVHQHVVPALVEAGLVRPGGPVHVVRGSDGGTRPANRQPPVAGADVVRLEDDPAPAVARARATPSGTGPPQVTVSIGRVQVVRNTPAAPPAPPPAAMPDHDAYLARRREGRP